MSRRSGGGTPATPPSRNAWGAHESVAPKPRPIVAATVPVGEPAPVMLPDPAFSPQQHETPEIMEEEAATPGGSSSHESPKIFPLHGMSSGALSGRRPSELKGSVSFAADAEPKADQELAPVGGFMVSEGAEGRAPSLAASSGWRHPRQSRRASRLSGRSRRSVGGISVTSGDSRRVSLATFATRVSGNRSPSSAPVTQPSLITVRKKLVRQCRWLQKDRIFQVVMLMALIAALLLPDLWILVDRPDNDDLDVLLTIVLFLFVCELLVQCIALARNYVFTFFFWMDLVGAASLLLDMSYVPNPLTTGSGNLSGNAVVVRLARVAKLGARAGRFTKLVKLMRFLPGIRDKGVVLGTAKMVSTRLTTVLSTRVSCLIIVMVMIMPWFSIWTFPEQDFSMTAWLEILQRVSALEDAQFAEQLEVFNGFYARMGYYPFELEAKPGAFLSKTTAAILPWHSSRGPPERSLNVMKLETDSLYCAFNFKQPTQLDSLMNVILMIFIMLLMVGYSILLSNSVSAIVMKPLDQLLMKVRTMASQIFQSVASLATVEAESEAMNAEESVDLQSDAGTNTNVFGGEAALLEKVLKKLAVVTDKTGMDEEVMAGMEENDRALITGYTGGKQLDSSVSWKWQTTPDNPNEDGFRSDRLLKAQKIMLQAAGLSSELINSWNINPLELDRARNRAAVTYFLGPQNHGITYDAAVMGYFLDAAEAGYIKTVAYHNWFHAVDVTHCVYRVLTLCAASEYLNNVERFALLVSATCHDVGHPGLNNIFLVEASYDLALLYNDKSPLENMHCARLFEFVSTPKCNIFAGLCAPQYQEVRKCCIEAILHTDNVHHFPMIKNMQMLYEVNSEVMVQARGVFKRDSRAFPTKDLVDVFRQTETRTHLVQLFLHMADISNVSKPFRICRIWANKVLEEFFFQGDEEKKAGIPVQALNDREKVNRPFSQVGFIEFLVSPLLFAVVRVLPPFLPFATQMVDNTRTWNGIWREETTPKPSDQDKQALADRVSKLEKRLDECR